MRTRNSEQFHEDIFSMHFDIIVMPKIGVPGMFVCDEVCLMNSGEP